MRYTALPVAISYGNVHSVPGSRTRLLIRETERYLSDLDVATGVDKLLGYGEWFVYARVFPLAVRS